MCAAFRSPWTIKIEPKCNYIDFLKCQSISEALLLRKPFALLVVIAVVMADLQHAARKKMLSCSLLSDVRWIFDKTEISFSMTILNELFQDETILYECIKSFVVFNLGCSMESHLTLNFNNDIAFCATIFIVAFDLTTTFMLNRSEMFYFLLLWLPFLKLMHCSRLWSEQQTALVLWPSLFGIDSY